MSAADSTKIAGQLEPLILAELACWGIGGVAVALVDGDDVAFAGGFGEAMRDSIFRVGSISKLLNAVAVMQQVEEGKLDLDAALPAGLLPINPFLDGPPVTLRQILSHRSGLQRESPVGGYFDHSQPALEETVRSILPCVLATRPAEKTRYSNLAPSLAGCLMARAAGKSFEECQAVRILKPLGMDSSAWNLAATARERIIVSRMRVADGCGGWIRREAPLFDLGTIPAGNLFSTVDDLAKFASALLAGGRGILRKASLLEMWQPQFTNDPAGFGLGFLIGEFRGHRTVSHSGAVYGHSSSFVLLPEQGIAVIVLANEDIVSGPVQRISAAALSLLLEGKTGETPPPTPAAAPPEDSPKFAGDYESGSFWAHLEWRDGQLCGEISGQPVFLRPAGPGNFAANSRLDNGTPVHFSEHGFTMGLQKFVRVAGNPPPLPEAWREVLGSYGPDFIPLVVSERHGHLYAMTENMVDYRLTPINRHTCCLPAGMYVDEHAVFLTGTRGKVHEVNFASMPLRKWT